MPLTPIVVPCYNEQAKEKAAVNKRRLFLLKFE